MRILIVEDDEEAGGYLSNALKDVGFAVDLAQNGQTGLERALSGFYDVLVVDRMLPKLDGLSLISKLRAENSSVPVLILSALGQVDDRVLGLRAGGDDYLTKPYAFSECLARIEALVRRQKNDNSALVIKVGDIVLDRLAKRVSRAGEDVLLNPREFKLLEYLMHHEGQVVTRKMLLENVWDYHFDPQTNIIDVHISRLRNKIELSKGDIVIHTVRGEGYKLSV